MAIKKYKVGPGTLKFGIAGATNASAQVRSCRVEWADNVQTSEAIPVLTGEEIPAETEVTYAASLVANLVQDIDAAGLVEWSWTNKGTDQLVEFIPNTAKGRKITGTVRVGPITLGGDAKDGAPSSDINWPFTVDPVLANVGV